MSDAANSTAPSSAAPRAGTIASTRRSRLAAFLDSDLLHSFLRSRLVVLAALVSVLIVGTQKVVWIATRFPRRRRIGVEQAQRLEVVGVMWGD